MRRALTTALLLGALGLAGCGSQSGHRLGAAEPATSPPLTTKPAGAVVHVADLPQGIAYDQRTGLLAVAVHDPHRLLVLDAKTLRTVRSLDLPGKARHLEIRHGGGVVLVPVETANELYQVDLRSGQAQVTKVGRHPHYATSAADGTVLVGNEFSGSVSVVRKGEVVQTEGGVRQPGGVVVDGDTVATIDVGRFAVELYRRDPLRRTGQLSVGKGPTHGLLTTRHRLAVADTRGGVMYTVGLHPLRILGHLDLGGSPYGMASDPATGLVWVTLTARNELVGLDYRHDVPRVVATYPTVRQPDTVTVSPGSHTLWVTGTRDGVVERIER